MKFRMSIMVLAILGGLACAGVASAQSRNPKFNTKRVSMSSSSSRPTAAPRGPVQPVGYLTSGHGHSAGCGCETIPSCGCDAAPSCGCDVVPSCGCDVAPSCGCDVPCGGACGGSAYCGGRSCCPPLIPALMHGIGSMLDALIPCHTGCGYSCPVYPVGPCNSHPRRVGLLAKLGSHCNGCGGCYNEPSCGCGNGSFYGSPINGGTIIEGPLEPLTNPFKDDAEMLAPPAPPEEARAQRSAYPYYARQNSPQRQPSIAATATRPATRSLIKRTSLEQDNANVEARVEATPVASRFIEDTSAAELESEVPVPPAQPVPSPELRVVPVNPLRPTSR